jgi:hypothetical protein
VTNTFLDFFLRNPQLILVFILSVQSVFYSNLYPVLIPFLFPNVIEFLDADKIHTHGMRMQALRVRRYIPNPFATSALEEDEWPAPHPAKFTSTNTGYRFYRRMGVLGTVLEGARKIMPPMGSDPRPVQLLSSRYSADSILIAAFVVRAYITQEIVGVI